ncbi:MAG: tyrosine-protein phosphatase [Chloroflexota bacterium]
MNVEGKRHLPLEGSHNIRDIGGYDTSSGEVTNWRTFLRADSLHRLTPEGQQALIDYGLRTVIDLRFAHEVESAPNVFANSDSVNYFNISLFANASPTNSPSGQRQPPTDLESIYKMILDERQSELKAVFDVMLNDAFPVLIHCTVGKDRAGVISALMLALAGVDHEMIAADYALTAEYGADLFDELRASAATAGRDVAAFERFLEAKPEAMHNTLTYLNENYGGVVTYLEKVGLTQEQIDSLRQQILGK